MKQVMSRSVRGAMSAGRNRVSDAPSFHNTLLNRERQLSRNPLSVEADGHCFAELNSRDRSSAHVAGVKNRKS